VILVHCSFLGRPVRWYQAVLDPPDWNSNPSVALETTSTRTRIKRTGLHHWNVLEEHLFWLWIVRCFWLSRTHPALTPARQANTRFTYHGSRGVREGLFLFPFPPIPIPTHSHNKNLFPFQFFPDTTIPDSHYRHEIFRNIESQEIG